MCVSFLHYRIQLKEREKEIVDLEARLEKVSGYNSETNERLLLIKFCCTLINNYLVHSSKLLVWWWSR